MKRFFKAVSVDSANAILLDGRPVRTPARAALALATAQLAQAVAAEWDSQGEQIDPRTMPLTGLANAAMDHVAPDPAAFAASLARYGEGDLLCYRAEGPDSLVARQATAWDPPLAWATMRYGVEFAVTVGIVHVAQPAATVARLGREVAGFDAFRLAALSPLITISGSLILALAVADDAIPAEAAFAAAHVDELWQAEQWGDDTLALEARTNREHDFLAAARFLSLLD